MKDFNTSRFKKAEAIALDKTRKLKEIYSRYFEKIILLLQRGLLEYAERHPNEFIFPVLKNEDFEYMEFDQNTRLSKYQYNQLQSKEAMYNRDLKKLQAFFKIDITLTSHISRHTYASLLFDRDPSMLYEISKGLGHTNLKITEAYLKSFDADVVDKPNIAFNKAFAHLKVVKVSTE